MSSIFDKFFAPEALKPENRSNSDIKVERDIKIQDSLRTDFASVKRYWPDVPEDHYQSEQYKSYCAEYQEVMASPVVKQLKCSSIYETRRLQAIRDEVELSKNWQQRKNLL